MYRLHIVTAIGTYVVAMEPEQENPTNDDLMKLFLETKSDVESGCFMEGWTPEDKIVGPPGVFALGTGLEVLAYHVERVRDIEVPEFIQEAEVTPVTFTLDYLGNPFHVRGVSKEIGDVNIIFCYDINGEPPTDVLDDNSLYNLLNDYMRKDKRYDPEEYLLEIATDGKPRNFSQAVEVLDKLQEGVTQFSGQKTGKAWNGWKGDAEE